MFSFIVFCSHETDIATLTCIVKGSNTPSIRLARRIPDRDNSGCRWLSTCGKRRSLLAANKQVSDGWPYSNARIGESRGGPAIRSTVLLN